MNTRPTIDESAGPVSLSVAFNQDSSCFSVGLDSGFCGMDLRELGYLEQNTDLYLYSIQFRTMRAQGLTRYGQIDSAGLLGRPSSESCR